MISLLAWPMIWWDLDWMLKLAGQLLISVSCWVVCRLFRCRWEAL